MSYTPRIFSNLTELDEQPRGVSQDRGLRSTLMNYWERGLEQFMSRPVMKQQTPAVNFDKYLNSIDKEMTVFKRNRLKIKQNKQIALGNVENCYKQLSKQFFDEKYEFLLPEAKQIRQQHDALAEKLDLIEIGLFGQVTSNFNQYLTLLNVTDQLAQLVQLNISKIQQGRDRIMKIQNKFLFQAIKLQELAIRRLSLLKTQQLILMCKHIVKLPKIVQQKMQTRQWDLKLFEELKNYKRQWSRCSGIKSVEKVGQQLQILDNQARSYLKTLIRDKIINYLRVTLKYQKQKWINYNVPKTAIMDEPNCSFALQITILDQSYFEVQEPAKESAQQIASLYQTIAFAKQLNLSDQLLSKQIVQILQEFTQMFHKDMKEYLIYILDRNRIDTRKLVALQKCVEHIEVGFYCKLIEVHFTCIKQFFKRVQKIVNSSLNPEYLDNTINCLREFVIQKIKYFMSIKKLPPNVDFPSFMQYISLIDFWIECETQLQSLNLHHLFDTKNQIIDTYLNNLHKQTMTIELKEAVETDKFSPMAIPSDYYTQLEFLLNPGNEESLAGQVQGTFNFSIRREIKRKSINLDQEEDIRVMNKTLQINGQRFMVCSSFLLLIEILEEYLKMRVVMKDYRLKINEKIAQLIGFYSWYVSEMLLKTGITKFGNIKVVMIKHLCMASLTFQLLVLIINKIQLNQTQKSKLLIDLNKNMSEISKKIISIIVFKIQDQVSEMYENRINTKPTVPTVQSKNIVTILTSVNQTLLEYYPIHKVKEHLNPTMKMLTQNYFIYLSNIGKRGLQQLDWFLPQLEVNFGQNFPEEIKEMRLQIAKAKNR